MRTQVIPAQITTVEDRIAGNLSLTQIIILLSPVLLTTLTYALLPPSMMFVWYKLGLTILFVIVCITLAIRIKGKIVLNWLVILTRYNLRPKYYLFDKNEVFAREVYLPVNRAEQTRSVKPAVSENKIENPSIQEMLQFGYLLNKENFNLRFRTGKKGGLHVAFEKVSK